MSKILRMEEVDGVTFELRPNLRQPTQAGRVCLRKTPKLIERYNALALELQGCNMVEVGIDQGGGTAYFTKLLRPKALLGIELSSEPVCSLQSFLEEHDKKKCVDVRWGVDQSDTQKVPELVQEVFGDEYLDVVVDDASHLYGPSVATFEMLFPRLRQAGVYIIEDWSADHLIERRLMEEAASDPEDFARRVAAVGDVVQKTPFSMLIAQLVVASARNPDWIPLVRVARGICEVRRGIAPIASGTPLRDSLGELGQSMFNV